MYTRTVDTGNVAEWTPLNLARDTLDYAPGQDGSNWGQPLPTTQQLQPHCVLGQQQTGTAARPLDCLAAAAAGIRVLNEPEAVTEDFTIDPHGHLYQETVESDDLSGELCIDEIEADAARGNDA